MMIEIQQEEMRSSVHLRIYDTIEGSIASIAPGRPAIERPAKQMS